ncbi:MAG: multiheme c-type cytochrome [Panacagrimonas sp.]
MRTVSGWFGSAAMAWIAFGSGIPASAADPLMPFEAKWQHAGVATCAGSNCHGSQQPLKDSPVQQDEYFLWQRQDAHSNAFKVLQGEKGKRIAANLGLKDAASARECLSCHSDDVPAGLRGRRYSLSEGVGCEACHGGAQKWLGPHVSEFNHAQNLEAGLYPLEDPIARARLCLNCHMGTAAKPIDHRIMGAGHPALEFEVQFFTDIQPAHFRVDADYRKRKPAYAAGAKAWAIGQIVAAETFLDGLLSQRFVDGGMFPELVFFDCNACHHNMRPPRWVAGLGGPLGPGQPRLADVHLTVSAILLGVLAPDTANQWNAALADLHKASGTSTAQTRDTAKRLRQITATALDGLRGKSIGQAEAATLIDRLAEAGVDRFASDYTATKQIYYGIDSLLRFLQQDHGLSKDSVKTEMGLLFASLDAQRYDPVATQNALRKLRAAVGTPP